MGETGGLILTNYVIEDFDISLIDLIIVNSQDFGFNHANCIGEVGFKDGEIYLCRELYVFEKIHQKSYSWLMENFRSELLCIAILLSRTELGCGRKQDTEHVRSRKSRTV